MIKGMKFYYIAIIYTTKVLTNMTYFICFLQWKLKQFNFWWNISRLGGGDNDTLDDDGPEAAEASDIH